MDIGFWKALKITAGVSIGWYWAPAIVDGAFKAIKKLYMEEPA